MKYKTLKHFNLPGHAHELTFSCFKKQALLNKELPCQWFINSLENARRKHQFHIWAYVIMPDHVHLILFPTEQEYSISKILWGIKVPVTLQAISYLKKHSPDRLAMMADVQPNSKTSFRFWQRGGGYDRNLTEPETIRTAIQYIHDNPVRKELVEKAEDWKWSNAGFYADRKDIPLSIDIDYLPF